MRPSSSGGRTPGELGAAKDRVERDAGAAPARFTVPGAAIAPGRRRIGNLARIGTTH